MLYGLKGTHPIEGELYQEFTKGERETAVVIARIWHDRGWKPRLIDRHWHSCRISALNSLIGQRKAA